MAQIARRQVAQLESMRSAGVSIQIRYQRVYPQKGGAHLLGYLGKPAAELRADSEGRYRPVQCAVAMVLNENLKLICRAKMVLRVSWSMLGAVAKGRWVSAMADIANRRSARRGDDLVLTIDATVQSILLKAMSRHQSGAAVVMDVTSGDVPGLVSSGL